MGRTTYIPEDERIWLEYFLSQAGQTGHGMDGFKGFQYQRGHGLGSFFRRVFRSIFPVVKRVGKSALKSAGKEALSLGASVAGDLVKGRELGNSLEEHGRNAAGNLLEKAGASLKRKAGQSGGSIGQRAVVLRTIPVKKPRLQQRRKKNLKRDIFAAKYNV